MKPSKSRVLPEPLLNTISYFVFFGFSPSFKEIHTFYPKIITEKGLRILLSKMTRQKKLISRDLKLFSFGITPGIPHSRSANMLLDLYDNLNYINSEFENTPEYSSIYTLPQYSIYLKNRASRQEISKNKLALVSRYIRTLSLLPVIRYIGISGSASMHNCRRQDDVDIFIITKKGMLFIGRFAAILFAILFRLRTGRKSVCLNLFFDESDLTVPHTKQNAYVAHETLQMKPVINKNSTYERFIKANAWAYGNFPNAKSSLPRGTSYGRRGSNPLQHVWASILSPLEYALKKLQLAIIRRNRTGLYLSPTQLWLFKKDFETKLKNTSYMKTSPSNKITRVRRKPFHA